MGGSASVVHGSILPERLRIPRPQSWFDKLLHRQRVDEPKEIPLGDTVLLEAPHLKVNFLGKAFRAGIQEAFPEPWPSTQAFFGYLEAGVMRATVRGTRTQDSHEPDWTVEALFSGCAGEGEVSAELGAHWFGMWFERHRDVLAEELLRRVGFVAGAVERWDEHVSFIPLGPYGYALRLPQEDEAPPVDGEGDWPLWRLAEVDHATVYDLADPESLARGAWDELAAAIQALPPEQCFCQWCAPDFDHSALARFLP